MAKRQKKSSETRKSAQPEAKSSSASQRPQGKPASEARAEMTEVVLPQDSNPLGYILGGRVMHLVDIAAAIAAHRHSNSYVVTASVDYLDFRNPVRIGDLLILKSQVNRVFNTSMEVGVKVFSENVLTGERKHTTSAYVTFVAIDEKTGKRKPAPQLLVRTAEDTRRYREALGRRKIRLAHRYKQSFQNTSF
jgi:acyl-CoA hydrolase